MFKLLALTALTLAGASAYARDTDTSKPAPVSMMAKKTVRLFVGPDCGKGCDNIRKILQLRHVTFEEIDVTTLNGGPALNPYGVKGYPTIIVGTSKFQGDDIMLISSMLAEAYGKDVLSPAERAAMAGHFDAKGHPKVVLYGTKWCGYCKAQRELLRAKKINFDDIDVESSEDGKRAYEALRGSGYPVTFVGYRRFNGVAREELLTAVAELTGRPQPNIR